METFTMSRKEVPRAVGDQIDLEEPWAGVVPLREGADGDLVAEPGPDPRGGGPARGRDRSRLPD